MGHGYIFTPEQVDNLLARAQDQRSKLQGYLQTIDPLKMIDLASAQDQAGSVLQANAVRTSFENLDKRITSQIAFLTDWINKLNGAKQNYMQQEHLTEAQWKHLTLGLES